MKLRMPSKRNRLKVYIPLGIVVIVSNGMTAAIQYPDFSWWRIALIVFVYFLVVKDLKELRGVE